MTKSEIEKLIEYLDAELDRRAAEGHIHTKGDIFVLLRDYPTECDKTAGPDYKALYVECETKRAELETKLNAMQCDMDRLLLKHAHYTGAVAAMETIFGRKFEPVKVRR